jgi:putative nucleotidyltransferase with HDIG domain
MAMTSKILQIVNSPLFGMRRRVLNPADACIFLGVETIQALVLSMGVFSQFRRKGRFSVEDLQTHSMQTASVARRIARAERLPREVVEECLLAGMLHDVGKLVMAVNCADEYERCLAAEEAGRPIEEIERDVFGVDHADAGMYLLRLWGLPESITAAVALHHRPAQSPNRSLGPLAIVHAADILAQNLAGEGDGRLDLEYLAAVKATSALAEWQRLAHEIANGEAA